MDAISPSEKLKMLLDYNMERTRSNFYFTHYGFIEYRIEQFSGEEYACVLDSVYIKPEERTLRNIFEEYLKFLRMILNQYPQVTELQCGVQGGLDSTKDNLKLVKAMKFKFAEYDPEGDYHHFWKEIR